MIDNSEMTIEEIKNTLEVQKSTTEEYRALVKRSLAMWMGGVVLALAGGIAGFIIMLASFSTSAGLAVFGACTGVIFLAVGLLLNSYTKRESGELCALKRRPLGYLLRAKISVKDLVIFAVSCALTFVFSVVSLVLFLVSDAAGVLFVILFGVLLGACAMIAVSYVFTVISGRYISEKSEVFAEIEYDFAKKTHRV